MQYNRFLPLFTPLITWLLMEIFIFKPKLIYVILVLIALLFFFTTRQFSQASSIDKKWWNFLILPSLFSIGLICFCTMVPSKSLVQILIFFNIIFLYFYFRIIYNFLIRTNAYQENSLENYASFGNFLTFYFIASAIYGLQAFLNIAVWQLMTCLIIAIALIVYQVLWVNKIDAKISLLYILVICLVLVELAWSISFLTLSYYVLGLILSLCYYVLIGLARFHLLGKIDRRIIFLYLTYGFISIFIVLLSARWL